MKPTIGRIVHFVNPFGDGKEIMPAIITKVHSDTCVNLQVFWDSGITDDGSDPDSLWTLCTYDGRPSPDLDKGTWCWPSRV